MGDSCAPVPRRLKPMLISLLCRRHFKGDHEPDMVYVEAAAKSIAPVLRKEALVIPSPPGWRNRADGTVAGRSPTDLSFRSRRRAGRYQYRLLSERVLPGQVMVELIKNDRVIGGMTPVCSARASAVQDFPRKANAW